MKTLTLKDGAIYTKILFPPYFPEYEHAILRLMTDNVSEPKLICPIMYFRDTDDGTLLIRPLVVNTTDIWWRALFTRELLYDEAVSVKANYVLDDVDST